MFVVVFVFAQKTLKINLKTYIHIERFPAWLLFSWVALCLGRRNMWIKQKTTALQTECLDCVDTFNAEYCEQICCPTHKPTEKRSSFGIKLHAWEMNWVERQQGCEIAKNSLMHCWGKSRPIALHSPFIFSHLCSTIAEREFCLCLCAVCVCVCVCVWLYVCVFVCIEKYLQKMGQLYRVC